MFNCPATAPEGRWGNEESIGKLRPSSGRATKREANTKRKKKRGCGREQQKRNGRQVSTLQFVKQERRRVQELVKARTEAKEINKKGAAGPCPVPSARIVLRSQGKGESTRRRVSITLGHVEKKERKKEKSGSALMSSSESTRLQRANIFRERGTKVSK